MIFDFVIQFAHLGSTFEKIEKKSNISDSVVSVKMNCEILDFLFGKDVMEGRGFMVNEEFSKSRWLTEVSKKKKILCLMEALVSCYIACHRGVWICICPSYSVSASYCLYDYWPCMFDPNLLCFPCFLS